MDKPKLYLNMILAENEPVSMVKRSIDSVKEYVDGMYITVTYSDQKPETSDLITLLQQYGAEVSYFAWIDDFSAARQYALDQVPRGEHTFVYWQDADDVLDGAENLPEVLDTADKLNWAGVFFVYWYRVELDARGMVKDIMIEQQRERIVRNNDTYHWRGMLHETLIADKQEGVSQHLRKECTVVHLTEESRIDRAMERNIRILEAQLAKEKHHDPRTLVYLARAYYDKGVTLFKELPRTNEEEEKAAIDIRDEWHDRSLLLFDEYLSGKGEIGEQDYIEQSGWPEERATAWQYINQIYLIRGDFGRALDAINQAIEEAPTFPQYYIDKAITHAQMKDFRRAKHWLNLATAIDIPQTTLMFSPRDFKVRALECDAHISMDENKLKRVIEDYEKLLEIDSDNELYRQNLLVANSLEAANKASQSIAYLGKYLTQIGEEEKVLPLLQAVPQDLQKELFYAEMRYKHTPPRMWEDNEIAILCGPGYEKWSPKNITQGIGGSEEAVVYLAQELNKLGWKVTVYASPEEDEGDYDGVTYLNYYKMNPQDLFCHMIIWRAVGYIDMKPKVRGIKLLWLHDMPNIPDFTRDRVDAFDKIAVLSEYHKDQVKIADGENYLPVPEEKFFLTRNGIPDLGITNWKGNPHRMCYVSSPDRGLIYLLKNWEAVRAAVPDAELHVYYGFATYDYMYRNNPAKIAFKKKIMGMMEQEGITYHGRIGHQKLAEEMNKCGVWAYPTDFTEISCISAMKAQAVGAVPVTTNMAALKETVRNGIRVDVDIQSKDGQKQYIEALVDILNNPKKQEEFRNMEWAQGYFSWKNVASQWHDLLSGKSRVEVMMSPDEWQAYLVEKKQS